MFSIFNRYKYKIGDVLISKDKFIGNVIAREKHYRVYSKSSYRYLLYNDKVFDKNYSKSKWICEEEIVCKLTSPQLDFVIDLLEEQKALREKINEINTRLDKCNVLK